MSSTTISTSNIFQREEIGKVRSAQEDSHDIATFTPNGDVFVVCDGMGGHVGGKTASSIAVRSIIEYLKKEKYPEPLQALDEALQFANIQILGYADEHPELKGMGTTACIVLLQGTKAYIAHVGDSRIYLYLGKEKQLHRLTKDHSYVQMLVDAGEISDEEAENHPNKNRILKALGIKGELRPSLNTVQPKKGDVFLICSDGLSGMVTDTDMERILMQGQSLEQEGNELIDSALGNGGLDNITLELIQITTSPYSRSRYNGCNLPNRVQQSIVKIRKKRWVVLAFVMILFLGGWIGKDSIISILIDYEGKRIRNVQVSMDSVKNIIRQGVDSLKIDSTIVEVGKRDTKDSKLKELCSQYGKAERSDKCDSVVKEIRKYIVEKICKDEIKDIERFFGDNWGCLDKITRNARSYKELESDKKKHENWKETIERIYKKIRKNESNNGRT